MTNRQGKESAKWFLIGFGIIFIGLLILKTQLSWLPSGEGLMRVKLWQYYIIEIRRAIASTGEFGPTSGSGSTAVFIFAQHLVAAGVGGLVTLGIRKLISRVRK